VKKRAPISPWMTASPLWNWIYYKKISRIIQVHQ